MTLIHRYVEAAQRNENPRVITRLPSGWAVMGETQVLSGYSLLLPDPVVPHLNAMTPPVRQQFLVDMARLGDAVLAVTGAARINYEILGNLEPALHAHVIPRFPEQEPDDLKLRPIWFYNWDAAPRFDLQRDSTLLEALRQALAEG